MNSFFFSFSHLSIVLLRIYFVTPIKKQYKATTVTSSGRYEWKKQQQYKQYFHAWKVLVFLRNFSVEVTFSHQEQYL